MLYTCFSYIQSDRLSVGARPLGAAIRARDAATRGRAKHGARVRDPRGARKDSAADVAPVRVA